MPEATTEKVAVWPTVTVWLAGWISSAKSTGRASAASGDPELVAPTHPERVVTAKTAISSERGWNVLAVPNALCPARWT